VLKSRNRSIIWVKFMSLIVEFEICSLGDVELYRVATVFWPWDIMK